jgi:hypothetical protein
MTKQMVRSLAFAFMAAPLLLIGCSDSSSNKTDSGMDGPTGKDGGGIDSKLADTATAQSEVALPPDSAPPSDTTVPPDDTSPIDTGLAPDVTTPPADTAIASDAPLPSDVAKPDAAAPDAAKDTNPATDVAAPKLDANGAVDTSTLVPDATLAVDTTVVPCSMATPFVGGPVTASLTLNKDCSPYTINSEITIENNFVLTIGPGVTLKFGVGTGISVGYASAGQLVTAGTAAEPVVLTSGATTPGAGDWYGIKLWDGTMNGTKIAYSSISYCGEAGGACIHGYDPAAGRVTIDHVTLSQVGTGADGIWEEHDTSNFKISNSTIGDISSSPTVQYAIRVPVASFAGIDSTNTFVADPAAPTRALIALITGTNGTIAADTTWTNPGTPIAVLSTIAVGGVPTPTLSIGAGTTLRFAQNIALEIGYAATGKLALTGTAANPVVLTSLNATPGAGDWGGIALWDGTAAISYANISYGGSISDTSKQGNVSLIGTTTTLTIDHAKLASSAGYGIYAPCTTPAASLVTDSASTTFASNITGTIGPGPAGATGCP